MMERKSTGIGKLDELVEGGFKERSINMVVGEPGTGKSTLALQYLLAGITSGEKAIYVSIEEQKDSFYENMSRLGFDLARHEQEGNLLFYECNALKLKEFLEKGSLGFENKIIEMKAKRLVLDSMSAFILLYDTEMKQRSAVQRLFEKLKTWDLTTYLVSEASQDYTQFGLEYLVDGLVKLYYRKVGHERVRTIEVYKMRGTKHQTVETVYRIEGDGIRLYPGETIL
ncbi:MAG: AAA family ATPase [Candidatus Altiarchaeales archaeon]|nr:AAA family ATPase [Candidatus Altiarchaeales archaeon]